MRVTPVLLPSAAGGAFITDWIGVHAIFGAFMVGLSLPRDNSLVQGLNRSIERGVSFALPLFPAVVGRNVAIVPYMIVGVGCGGGARAGAGAAPPQIPADLPPKNHDQGYGWRCATAGSSGPRDWYYGKLRTTTLSDNDVALGWPPPAVRARYRIMGTEICRVSDFVTHGLPRTVFLPWPPVVSLAPPVTVRTLPP